MWKWLRACRKTRAPRALLHTRPALEVLEDRMALSGNVTAQLVSGSLIVTGDNNVANLTVSQARRGQITLTGADTKINGASRPVTFSGLTGDLVFNFGTGSDSLTFDQTRPIILPGSLTVHGGQQTNSIATLGGSAGPLQVGGSLNIDNLPGATEIVSLLNLNVKRNVDITNPSGTSLVTINVASASGAPSASLIGGNLVISNGSGQVDQINLSSTHVLGSVHITNQADSALTDIGSSGRTTVGGDLQVQDGPGQVSQTVLWNTRIDHNLQLAQSGPGTGGTIVASSHVTGTTDIQGADGDSGVIVTDAVFSGAFHLQTGNGADTVSIGIASYPVMLTRYVPVTEMTSAGPVTKLVPEAHTVLLPSGRVAFYGNATMGLGAQDDTLNLAQGATVRFGKGVTLDGQAGSNTANVKPANLPVPPTLVNFQVNHS